VKVKHSSLLVTSLSRYISIFVSNRFCHWTYTYDEIFAESQRLWSYTFVQDVSGQTLECWWSENFN